MTDHIVIQREEFTGGTREKPEIGVVCRCRTWRGVPFRRVNKGDTVWVKWSSGPIFARGKVADVWETEYRDIDEVRQQTRGFRLFDLDGYWNDQPRSGFATIVFLSDEERIEPFSPSGRAWGAGWIVLPTRVAAERYLSPSVERPVALSFEQLAPDGQGGVGQPMARTGGQFWIAERYVYARDSAVAVSISTVPLAESDQGRILQILNDSGFKLDPIEKFDSESLRWLLTHVIAEPSRKPESLISMSTTELQREALAADWESDVIHLSRTLITSSYVPIPRSPGLRSLSLKSLLVAPFPISAWLGYLEPWQALALVIATPLYIVIIGAATGASEGLRDLIYRAITGRDPPDLRG